MYSIIWNYMKFNWFYIKNIRIKFLIFSFFFEKLYKKRKYLCVVVWVYVYIVILIKIKREIFLLYSVVENRILFL